MRLVRKIRSFSGCFKKFWNGKFSIGLSQLFKNLKSDFALSAKCFFLTWVSFLFIDFPSVLFYLEIFVIMCRISGKWHDSSTVTGRIIQQSQADFSLFCAGTFLQQWRSLLKNRAMYQEYGTWSKEYSTWSNIWYIFCNSFP